MEMLVAHGCSIFAQYFTYFINKIWSLWAACSEELVSDASPDVWLCAEADRAAEAAIKRADEAQQRQEAREAQPRFPFVIQDATGMWPIKSENMNIMN